VTSVPEPSELLSLSRGLLLRFDPEIAGLWPRASALLARQALENALDRYWSARSLALQACSTHAQLICASQAPRPNRVPGDAQKEGRGGP
jgi:hypothetical protein